jgi:hypothetical protein
MHVHLVGDVVDDLLATMDRHDIAQAVVLASPHLDSEPATTNSPCGGPPTIACWRRQKPTVNACCRL